MWGDRVIVERKEYLEKLIAWKDKKLIKIVTGVRRCGKSMLLEIYQNYLKQHNVEKEQIIAINFENLDYEELTDYKKLYNYLKEHLVINKMTYIFLDEIQNVPDFPKVLDSFRQFIYKEQCRYLCYRFECLYAIQ